MQDKNDQNDSKGTKKQNSMIRRQKIEPIVNQIEPKNKNTTTNKKESTIFRNYRENMQRKFEKKEILNKNSPSVESRATNLK